MAAPFLLRILLCLLVGASWAFNAGAPLRAAASPPCRRVGLGLRMAGGFGKKVPTKGGGKGKGAKKAAVATPQTEEAKAKQAVMNDVQAIVDSVDDSKDPFWQLLPHILATEFEPSALERVNGFIKFATGEKGLPQDIIDDPWRPHEDIHAFMDGIPAAPFRDPSLYPFTAELEANYETIKAEFAALREQENDRFQSVTSMNYESGWKTLVLFFNGHKIDGFPYHLCPVTTSILEKVPVAGRIAGFNRQAPNSGIPLHSDGNNMWLTCQMGIDVPSDNSAYIRVAEDKAHWENGKAIVYDTTYEHETFNPNTEEDRVVLHVDFWNFGALTPTELAAMQRVYQLREAFLEAEGLIEPGGKL
mmetsp:Transcript_19377/g.47554  ORF Transcript_19377/g.47554 Transcript_19377/m.47554 type:complete len:360 (+) Transcript_19377:143-1222(+)